MLKLVLAVAIIFVYLLVARFVRGVPARKHRRGE
jgi:hypothetical protein